MQKNDMVLISVDDHISEPPDLFKNHLSGPDLESAPQFVVAADGTSAWSYSGMYMPSVGLNAVVGRPLEEYGMEPTSFDQLRKGVYDVDARVDDMNVNGIAASLNFGSAVGFDGGRFHKAQDRKAAVAHLRAYNDWHIDEWCGAHPGRFIPCAILPTWDMDACVAEIDRVARKGAKAVSVNENPGAQGLPSIHNEYWAPFFKAITDADLTICCHIGAGHPAPHASMESPIEAWITTMPLSISTGAADWLQLKALHDYPSLRIALSEGGIGWVPYFMERADYSNWRHKAWTNTIFQDIKPSEIFQKHFLNCFIDDKFGLQNVQFIGEDNIAFETDYPHSDTLWPDAPEHLWDSIKHLTDTQIDKITHLNAIKWFNFDMFGTHKKEDMTVGALRAKAEADGVDTTPRSSGGAKPVEEGTTRPITSGDLMRMFKHHAKEETAS